MSTPVGYSNMSSNTHLSVCNHILMVEDLQDGTPLSEAELLELYKTLNELGYNRSDLPTDTEEQSGASNALSNSLPTASELRNAHPLKRQEGYRNIFHIANIRDTLKRVTRFRNLPYVDELRNSLQRQDRCRNLFHHERSRTFQKQLACRFTCIVVDEDV